MTRPAVNRPRRKSAAAADAEPKPLDRAKLEQLALSYLNRFDVSSHKLEQHLLARARKLGAPSDVSSWIAELIARYQSSGLLNDARFAEQLAAQLAARGKSSRAIAQKLAARGITSQQSSDVLSSRKLEAPEGELQAAITYARKRRLGAFRALADRQQFRQKDLATLARQGFSFDIARQALGAGAGSEDEF